MDMEISLTTLYLEKSLFYQTSSVMFSALQSRINYPAVNAQEHKFNRHTLYPVYRQETKAVCHTEF